MGRRVFEAASRNLPVVVLIFIPLLFRLPGVYHWAEPGVTAGDVILQKKAGYLNVGVLHRTRRRLLRRLDVLHVHVEQVLRGAGPRTKAGSSPATRPACARSAAPGLLAYALTTTFASVDWIMSLDPHWYSTIFGLLFIVGQGLTAFAFVIAVLALLATTEPIASYLTSRHFHDLGKLLLAFVMLWAYSAFSQFLIIWGGNLPEEMPWYLERTTGSWGYVALVARVRAFRLPFTLLLSRDLKKQAARCWRKSRSASLRCGSST